MIPANQALPARPSFRLRDLDRVLLAIALLLAALAVFAPVQLVASLRFLGSHFAGLAPLLVLSAALAAAIKASGAPSPSPRWPARSRRCAPAAWCR